MFENPIISQKPITISLRSDMTESISGYITNRKLDDNIQFDVKSGFWLDRHQTDNKLELRKEWCKTLTPMFGLSETKHMSVWDVVTTNLQYAYLITQIQNALIDHTDDDFNKYIDEWAIENNQKNVNSESGDL